MAAPRQVVVNVDDLGLHPAVNRFVAEAAGTGAITSASVMANGPHFAEAEAMRAEGRFDGIGIGAHLNILRGRPLSPVGEVRSLVDREGLFPGSFARLYRNLALGRADPAEAELEWARQIEHLLERGFSLDHLDAEQHTHCIPRLWPVIGRLARRFDLGWVRRPYEPATPAMPPAGRLKTMLLRRWISAAPPLPAGVRTVEAVWGIAHSGHDLSARRLSQFLETAAGDGPVEIICHPGMPLPGDPRLAPELGRMKVHRNWRIEADVIAGPEWGAALARSGVAPCNYGSIG